MPHVTYIEHSGARRTVEVANGLSVMEGAVGHGVPGIDGDCGGACACATCHVYVDPSWAECIPPASELEMGMLEMAVEPTAFSRLACQIRVAPALDGLVVTTPKSQY
ncbi:MAG TPA: 2Fe-2S iron-sulfur cluster-binding protein [Rhizomicrobium sp.]|nr:2Fe-2S iron-sulfur cluster-binding protein [Rhizomicrobium sp.]